MIIAVNTRLQEKQQPEVYKSFLFTCLNGLTIKYPQHQFIFIFDKVYDEQPSFAKNVTLVVTGPQTTNTLRLQYWFNFKIPKVLRQYKADVFLSMEGIGSLRTKKPQCLFIADLGFVHRPQLQKKWLAGFYKKYIASFLAKAATVAVVSEAAELTVHENFKIEKSMIQVIPPGIDKIFKPLGWEEKEKVREKYSDGKAYFLFSGNTDQRSNMLTLLKAFSLFKRRQKSNMLLVIAGNADEQLRVDLKTYKFRNEVRLMENLSKDEQAEITAAAYAMLYPVLYCDLALPALQSMKCQVPVLVSNAGALPQICGNAALYCHAENQNDIAEKMMLLFKDEDMANRLVEAGKKIIQKHDAEKSAELLMQSIQKAFNS